MTRLRIELALFVLFPVAAAIGSDSWTKTHRRALLAGHQSMFTCSAVFNAGREWSDIRTGELDPEFLAAYFGGATVPDPLIDRDGR
ncbi:MAG: hypothetical protein R3200_17445, partial [Xanthomonadales bacterium]|nr:hypothetical protein [Xanthomonadales bacterium]